MGLRDRQIMRLIVGPQALRVMLPPSVGVYVATLKDSSIASVIGYVELTKTGLLIRDSIGHGFEILAYCRLDVFRHQLRHFARRPRVGAAVPDRRALSLAGLPARRA